MKKILIVIAIIILISICHAWGAVFSVIKEFTVFSIIVVVVLVVTVFLYYFFKRK